MQIASESKPHSKLLAELLAFVRDEREQGQRKLIEVWNRPLRDKLESGWSQRFVRLERAAEPTSLWAYPGEGDSRFREGDLLLLHRGSPTDQLLGRGFTLESEEEDRWLLRGNRAATVLEAYGTGDVFADPDAIDLAPYYERALEEIGTSQIGRDVVLPLLDGKLDVGFLANEVGDGEAAARLEGLNAKQVEAVGLAYGAEYVACIQGPPGTGKTQVLALIVQLMAARGERVLVTSHTHMAINNALNRVQARGVPCVKIGRLTQCKGLDAEVMRFGGLDDWEDRPTDGYVVGATPFATCSSRLETYEFDSIVFDEASQITVPLALMAMRKGRRFIFVGDHKQLPPVTLSRSVLSKDSQSVFAQLTSRHADHTVMLESTYRMNRSLTAWPSRTHYEGRLHAAEPNAERKLAIKPIAGPLAAVLEPSASGIFIPTLDRSARTQNFRDAALAASVCEAALQAGLPLHEIGIVTPYRAQGRALRKLLAQRLGRAEARKIVADTVERMQGQERELVILSLATGDEAFLSAVAPFFFQPERLNVSITRARTKLIVIGPKLDRIPACEDPTLRLWMAQYAECMAQLQELVL